MLRAADRNTGTGALDAPRLYRAYWRILSFICIEKVSRRRCKVKKEMMCILYKSIEKKLAMMINIYLHMSKEQVHGTISFVAGRLGILYVRRRTTIYHKSAQEYRCSSAIMFNPPTIIFPRSLRLRSPPFLLYQKLFALRHRPVSLPSFLPPFDPSSPSPGS